MGTRSSAKLDVGETVHREEETSSIAVLWSGNMVGGHDHARDAMSGRMRSDIG